MSRWISPRPAAYFRPLATSRMTPIASDGSSGPFRWTYSWKSPPCDVLQDQVVPALDRSPDRRSPRCWDVPGSRRDRASRRKRWSSVELRARLRIRTLSATSWPVWRGRPGRPCSSRRCPAARGSDSSRSAGRLRLRAGTRLANSTHPSRCLKFAGQGLGLPVNPRPLGSLRRIMPGDSAPVDRAAIAGVEPGWPSYRLMYAGPGD